MQFAVITDCATAPYIIQIPFPFGFRAGKLGRRVIVSGLMARTKRKIKKANRGKRPCCGHQTRNRIKTPR